MKTTNYKISKQLAEAGFKAGTDTLWLKLKKENLIQEFMTEFKKYKHKESGEEFNVKQKGEQYFVYFTDNEWFSKIPNEIINEQELNKQYEPINYMKGKVFTAQQVQAILNGSTVMFREVIKPQPIQPEGFSDAYFDCYNKGNQWNWWTKDNKQLLGQIVKCPYQVGQKIFCKEPFYAEPNGIRYFSEIWDNTRKWRSAQHMKQEHSRLTPLIKEIRVEKLGDISEEDAIKEGGEDFVAAAFCKPEDRVHVRNFKKLWNATHKKPEEKFEASPFVWVYTMEVVK